MTTTQKHEAERLKPCPFCGGNTQFGEHDDECYFTVLGQLKKAPPADLGLMIPLIEAWNRRIPTLEAENAELKARLDAIEKSMRDGLEREARLMARCVELKDEFEAQRPLMLRWERSMRGHFARFKAGDYVPDWVLLQAGTGRMTFIADACAIRHGLTVDLNVDVHRSSELFFVGDGIHIEAQVNPGQVVRIADRSGLRYVLRHSHGAPTLKYEGGGMSKALFVQLLRSIKSLPMSQAGWIVLIEGVDEKPDWLVGCPIARLSNGENLGLGYDCQPYNGWKVEYRDGKCVVVYEDQEGQS